VTITGLGLLAAVLAATAARGAPRESTQYGFRRLEFRVRGSRAFVLLPKKFAKTRPWVWYAPTLRDKYPNEWHDWLFQRLLARGFAVCGIDVGESWGNPKGRAEFTRFYEYMVKKHELSPRACLFAESRGGLMAFNWAADHPDKVQCIGAVYPVCKITPSPFFARVYKLAGEGADHKANEAALEEQIEKHNPMDRLAPLAKAKVPILLMHGTRDKLVPAAAHSAELARRYIKLGGEVTLIVRRNARHEPSDLFFESEELLRFFLDQVPDEKTPAYKEGREGPAPE
jgi:dipeptidyl aminopeptidase/acylaminoacyl peptidase